ncbi:hypothetical protein WJX81_001330 [Elliptochloris bilobata]|uniref:ABC transporter domain-containing protein n=1 Tax=Elliptochloris bilobata TaxID=381761 RepID=A0AAW1SID1_9CHLO
MLQQAVQRVLPQPTLNGCGKEAAAEHQASSKQTAAALPALELKHSSNGTPPAAASREVSASRAAELASDPLLQQAHNALAGARTLAAHQAVSALCEREGCAYAALAAHSAALGLDLTHLQDQTDLICEVLDSLPDDEGFTCVVKSEPRVMHRKESGSSHHTIKYSADVPAPLEHALALCVEYDLLSTWQSGVMLDTLILCSKAHSETFYGAIWTPLMIFETLVEGHGHDLGEEQRCLMLTLQDAPEPLPPGVLPLPPATAKRKRGGVVRGTAILLEALPPGPGGGAVTQVRIIARLDPRLPFVPGFLISFLLKVVAPYVYRQVQQVLELFNVKDSYMQRRFAQNAALYEGPRPPAHPLLHSRRLVRRQQRQLASVADGSAVDLRTVGLVPEHSHAEATDDERPHDVQGEHEAVALPPKNGVRVQVRDLYKEYKTKSRGVFVAAKGIDMDIEANSITALVGPSGSGKTTLLRLIAGLEEPTSGQILFDDTDATHISVQDRRIGFVFQSYALFRHMTCADNISFGPRMKKLDINVEERVRELLELVGLPDMGLRYPTQLSGGQRQRIALARALAMQPRLLLMDEPFGALDPAVRESVRQGVKDIIKRIGVTTIIVTHDQEEAFDIADRVVIFNRGRVEQVGTPEDIRSAPASAFVLNFISDVNHLPATCTFVRRMGVFTSKPMVMFRPTEVEVATTLPSTQPARYVPATVVDRIDLYYMIKYFMRFDDGLRIEMHDEGEDWEPPKGIELDLEQRVYVRVEPERFVGFTQDELAV